jgi:nucleoid-associated protein YgaU
MALETKMGMCVIVILLCAFGFLVYRKFDVRQQQLLQVNSGATGEQNAAGSASDQENATVLASFQQSQELKQPNGTTIADQSAEVLAGMAPDSGVMEASPFGDGFPELNEPIATDSSIAGQTAVQPVQEIDPFQDPAFGQTEATQSATAEPVTRLEVDPFASEGAAAAEVSNPVAVTDPAEVVDPFMPQPADANSDKEESENLFGDVASSTPTAEPLAEPSRVTEYDNFPEAGAGEENGVLLLPVSESSSEPVAVFGDESPVLTIPDEQAPAADSDAAFADFSGLTTVDENGPELKPASEDTSNLLAMLDEQQTETAASQSSAFDEPTPVFPDLQADQGAESAFGSLTIEDQPSDSVSQQTSGLREPDLSDTFLADDTEEVQITSPDNSGAFDFLQETDQPPRATTVINQAVGSDGGMAARFDVKGYNYDNGVQQASHSDDACKVLVVQPNENYWKISKRAYGTARYFSALALYNQHRISDPKKMRPGMKVLIPEAEVLEARYPELFKEFQAKPSLPGGYFITQEGTPAYRIGASETLSEIAEKHLGRSSRWVQIYRMNQHVLKDPNKLKLGLVLQLPDDATDIHMAP